MRFDLVASCHDQREIHVFIIQRNKKNTKTDLQQEAKTNSPQERYIAAVTLHLCTGRAPWVYLPACLIQISRVWGGVQGMLYAAEPVGACRGAEREEEAEPRQQAHDAQDLPQQRRGSCLCC